MSGTLGDADPHAMARLRGGLARRPGQARSERHGGGFAVPVWLTWRQHRWALICAFVLTVLFAGWMVYLSVHVMTLYEQCGASPWSRSTPAGAALWSDFGPIRRTETLAKLALLDLYVAALSAALSLASAHLAHMPSSSTRCPPSSP